MFIIKKIFNARSAKTFERTLDFYGLTLRRYKIALAYSKNKKVLDIGSGLGQGSHFLAANGAKKVLGIDYSKKAVDFAAENFILPNLEFKTLSGLKVRNLKRKFDVISSQYNNLYSEVSGKIERLTGIEGSGAEFLTDYQAAFGGAPSGGGGTPQAGEVRNVNGADYKWNGQVWELVQINTQSQPSSTTPGPTIAQSPQLSNLSSLFSNTTPQF